MHVTPAILAVGGLLLLSAHPKAQSGTFVFTPVEDAPVRLSDPDTNYSDSDLMVEWGNYSASSGFRRAFLRFLVEGVDGPIDCATLVLSEGSAGTAADAHFEVRRVAAPWDEDTLTWNNQPGTAETVGAFTGDKLEEGEEIHIPLDPSFIQDGFVSLALIEYDTGGTNDSNFDSREDDDPPQLVLGCSDTPTRAGFSLRLREGAAPYSARFDNHSSRDAVSWSWDFGDGSTSSEADPVHVFAEAGRYDVSLTVTDDGGGTHTQVRPGYVFAYPPDTPAGEVLCWKKISSIRGGNTPRLDNEDMFARGSAVIGDVDGDGVDDFLVGANGDDDGDTEGEEEDRAGAAHVLFMNADLTVRDSQKISNLFGGLQADLDERDGFGRVVAGIGDLDLDGTPDIAVGANRDDDGGTNRGAVHVLFLNPDGTVKDEQKISSTEGAFDGDLDNGDEFGRGIACMGDLDLDGIQDLAVGATGDDDGDSDNGAVWVLFMQRDGTVASHAKISDTQGGITTPFDDRLWFGMSVTTLGDVDGDGVEDMGVGGLLDDGVDHGSGAAFILLMNRDGSVKSDHFINAWEGGWVVGELEANDEFGGAVAGPGDVDGDGVPDFVCSSIRDNDNHTGDTEQWVDRGAVYLFFLKADGTVRDYQKISDTRGNFDASLNKGDRFGESLGWAGDLNGDGTPDLISGSRFDDEGGSNRGALYLLYLNDGTRSAPVADFSGDPTSGPAPLVVSFADDSSGDYETWSWDFGDGSSSTDSDPTHVYQAEGSYTVELTVSGSSGSDTRSFPNAVRVAAPLAPVAAFAATNTVGVAPLEVSFTNDTTGIVDAWAWDFGDGATATVEEPTHTYVDEGTYTVLLTATGPGGSSSFEEQDLVVVAAAGAPVAALAADPTSGDAPLSVSFTDLSEGFVLDRVWDFGDGTTGTDADTAHTYSLPGTYTVSLTVSGPGGTSTESVPSMIRVLVPAAPSAAFASAPAAGIDPLPVQFTDASAGYVTDWLWDFGDGESSTVSDPLHTYVTPGIYDVSLTVTGPGGVSTLAVPAAVDVQSSMAAGIADPGFEAQVGGLPPAAPWISPGVTSVVRDDVAGDLGFPSEGTQWLELLARGPLVVGAEEAGPFEEEVTQRFRFADGRSLLRFDAAFLFGGAAGTDGMARVLIDDGSGARELFRADGEDELPETSAASGLPSTGLVTIEAELMDLFPSATDRTLFDLTLELHQAAESATPSRAYLDRFELVVSSDVVTLGCGVNPPGSLTLLDGTPALGQTVTVGIDNPLGTQVAGALPVLAVSLSASPDYPCGALIGGLGMAGPGAAGELLIGLPVALSVVGQTWAGPSVPAPVSLRIPQLSALVGIPVFLQGRLVDTSPEAEVSVGLTDALELLIGP